MVVSLTLVLSSCATVPVSHTSTILPDNDDNLGGTGIESTDILTVSRKMALSILEVPEIMRANGTPRIALLPVKNNTRFIINKDIFTQKIRIELNKNVSGKVRFLARDRMDDILKERQAKRNDLVTASKEGDLAGVDFYLTGELTGLSKAANSSRSDYILMSFQLIDAETSDIIWEDAYETKRVGAAGVVYQ
ncbi:MAG: penicillin-binding protein activator LpoB [Candidatus Omnitrophica bacterium]|nr:penicillin-binding protein activator LpoB [Candidatus Omnitrophota bacterium]MBU2035239.1 penicillin-binding protein activator LpoB [Candidatus Omnitrophota bacterium]MBU2257592.1 penicillin-binding protein activator LpoB [Candidatus Omnitrophota bacterium]